MNKRICKSLTVFFWMFMQMYLFGISIFFFRHHLSDLMGWYKQWCCTNGRRVKREFYKEIIGAFAQVDSSSSSSDL